MVRLIAGSLGRLVATVTILGVLTLAAPYLVAMGLTRTEVFGRATPHIDGSTVIAALVAITFALVTLGWLRRRSCRRWLVSGRTPSSLYRRNVAWSLLRTTVAIGGFGLLIALWFAAAVAMGDDGLPVEGIAESPAGFQVGVVLGIILVWSLVLAVVPTRRYTRRAAVEVG